MPCPFDSLPSFNWLTFVRPYFFWPLRDVPHPFCPLLVLALKPSRSFHQRKTFRNQEGGAKYPQLPGHGCFGLSTDRPRKPHLGFPAYIQVSINTDTYISERESTLRSPALTQHQRFHPRSPSPRVHRRPPPGFILDPPLHQGSSSSHPPSSSTASLRNCEQAWPQCALLIDLLFQPEETESDIKIASPCPHNLLFLASLELNYWFHIYDKDLSLVCCLPTVKMKI